MSMPHQRRRLRENCALEKIQNDKSAEAAAASTAADTEGSTNNRTMRQLDTNGKGIYISTMFRV